MTLPISISGWLPTIVAAIFLSFMLIGIARMIARGFHLPYLDMWAKVETQEFIITLLIVASLSTIIGISDSIAQATTNTSCQIGDCLLNTAIARVESRTANSGAAFLQLKDLYRKLGKWTNFYKSYMTGYLPIIIPLPPPISTAPPAIIFTRGEAPGQGMGLFFGPMSNAANIITLTIAENIALAQFLEFVKVVSLPILLPLGILLRGFSITRRAGSTLIAISFGLSMVLPASVILGHDQLYEPAKANIVVGSIDEPKLPPPYICNVLFTLLWDQFGISGFTIPGGLSTYIEPYCTSQCIGTPDGGISEGVTPACSGSTFYPSENSGTTCWTVVCTVDECHPQQCIFTNPDSEVGAPVVDALDSEAECKAVPPPPAAVIPCEPACAVGAGGINVCPNVVAQNIGDIPYHGSPQLGCDEFFGCCATYPGVEKSVYDCEDCLTQYSRANNLYIPDSNLVVAQRLERVPGTFNPSPEGGNLGSCGPGPIYIPHTSALVTVLSAAIGESIVGPPPGCNCCTVTHCWAWCSLNLEIWYHGVNFLWGTLTAAVMKSYMNNPPAGQATSALYSATDGIAYNAMISTILIILSAFVTASFIRSISEMIGGDTRLYGLYRLV